MTILEKKFVATQVASALVYMHSSSPAMIHGDVKPSNILVSVVVVH